MTNINQSACFFLYFLLEFNLSPVLLLLVVEVPVYLSILVCIIFVGVGFCIFPGNINWLSTDNRVNIVCVLLYN